jgi:uncharacterized membrane protein YwaF
MTEQLERKPTDWTGVIIGALLLPVLLVFIHLGKQNLGRTVCICLGMIMLAIRVRWDLRRHVWFWGIIVGVMALHVPFLFMVRWPSGWVPAVAMLPVALADCLIILGAVYLVEKLTKAKDSPDE